MNAAGDSNERTAAEAAQADSSEPAESLTPGELLRRERERRSISRLHIAEELHLDARIVDAIEANRFEELGVPVYARGHLRQYAALLGLSPQFIIQRYEALTGPQDVPAPIPASVAVSGSIGMQRRSLAGPLWAGVALIASALGWWLWATVSTPGDPMESALIEPSAETSAVPAGEQPLMPAQTEIVEAPAPASGAASASQGMERTSGSTAAAAPAAGEVRLRLEFSDASWAEIHDANGKRLMFGLGESGRVRSVSGTAPLRVTLGKASAVTVQVNDKPVVVPRRAGRDAAKFVIASDGSVQISGEVPVE